MSLKNESPAAVRASMQNQVYHICGAPPVTLVTCSTCHSGKLSRCPYYSFKHKYEPGDIFYNDFCGPLRRLGKEKERYFINFTDVGSTLTFVMKLQNRIQAPRQYRTY